MLNPLTHRKILKKGRPGKAVITAFAMPERGAAKQNLPMTLEVHVEGLSPYVVEDQWIVSRKDSLGFGMEIPVKVDADDPQKVAIDWKAARRMREAEKARRSAELASRPAVGSGWGAAGAGGAGGVESIDARNDPELRAKLEKVLGRKLEPGTQETLDVSNDPALAAQVMAVVQQHQAEKAAAAAAPAGGGEDPIGKLERLAKLRDSGALTDEEFEQQKRDLLGRT